MFYEVFVVPPHPQTIFFLVPSQGVEYGEECFCWKNNKRYKRKGRLNKKKCNVNCVGDSKRTCGGSNALEVFKIKNLDYDENVSPPR